MKFDTKSILERLKQRRAEAEAKATQEQADKAISIEIQKSAEAKVFGDSPLGKQISAIVSPEKSSGDEIYDRYGNLITLNAQQSAFVETVRTGQSAVMIGAAGTGKTTCTNAAVQALLQDGLIPPIPKDHGHKHLYEGTPGIVICAFTRRATNNIRQNQAKDIQNNCITIHKLLQFEPEVIEIEDEATGMSRNSKQFIPKYNKDNPLPACIKTIIIEEASMVGLSLWDNLMDAIQHKVQFIFLGDLNQLPPVFGPAILGFKLLSLPVVELTQVYRQALDSPIISLAHRILSTKPIHIDELQSEWANRLPLRIIPWKKKISPENATKILSDMIVKCINAGEYDPESDGILIPFNKSCGTDELNKYIANALAKKESKDVHEIIHKWKRSYYAVGDKCLYEKEDAIILEIYTNEKFSGGMSPRPASPHMDYWGNYHGPENHDFDLEEDADVDFLLSSVGVSSGNAEEDNKNAASHVIKLHLLDSDRVVTLDSAGQIESLILGYAITVHKSQGSEWKKVFLFFHASHATMISRELLYTAVTRAKKELIIVCEQNTFVKGIENARIQGKTLAEKAEYFKGKQAEKDADGRSDNM